MVRQCGSSGANTARVIATTNIKNKVIPRNAWIASSAGAMTKAPGRERNAMSPTMMSAGITPRARASATAATTARGIGRFFDRRVATKPSKDPFACEPPRQHGNRQSENILNVPPRSADFGVSFGRIAVPRVKGSCFGAEISHDVPRRSPDRLGRQWERQPDENTTEQRPPRRRRKIRLQRLDPCQGQFSLRQSGASIRKFDLIRLALFECLIRLRGGIRVRTRTQHGEHLFQLQELPLCSVADLEGLFANLIELFAMERQSEVRR